LVIQEDLEEVEVTILVVVQELVVKEIQEEVEMWAHHL